jgi:hypothetical protein
MARGRCERSNVCLRQTVASTHAAAVTHATKLAAKVTGRRATRITLVFVSLSTAIYPSTPLAATGIP